MSTEKQTLNGAEIIVKCLEEQGVDTVFGYPGGAVIPLYDALHRLDHRMNEIVPCHEQNGTHAADGYARSTGKTGVMITTSGPGATNAITGIATAYLDSVPLVVFTGQVPQTLLGKDAFQEVDVTSVTMQITKHNILVTDVDKLADTVREAFKIARAGRPGPVVLDVPKDVQLATTDTYEYKEPDTSSLRIDYPVPNEKRVKKIASIINNSKKPVIYAGGGVKWSGAEKELLELAEKSHIPVVNSLMGLGGFPRTHEQSLGLVGMHGFVESNLATINCDLLIVIGARYSDRVTGNIKEFTRDKTIVQIDIDEAEFGKNVKGNVYLHADIKDALPLITDELESTDRTKWWQQIEEWREIQKEPVYNPENILNRINESYPDAIVATEVGQHQMWTGQYWKFKDPKKFLTSGGLGTMGYGLGAAIGAQLGNPEEDVVLIAGDGSFRMNCQEMATVSKYKLPVKIFVFNNSALGMVRQWQNLFHDKRYAQTDVPANVDYVKWADACGIKGYTISTLEELEQVLADTKDSGEPVLVNCIISNDENVFPIVPPGAPIDKLRTEE
jgi:acetolactate synthase-1/2/3 large subunit